MMSAYSDQERVLDDGLDEHDGETAELTEEKDPEIAAEVFSEDEIREEAVEPEETGAALSSIQQYLHEIGSVPLLSREREIKLAMQIERAPSAPPGPRTG
jgi:hypothetical protein